MDELEILNPKQIADLKEQQDKFTKEFLEETETKELSKLYYSTDKIEPIKFKTVKDWLDYLYYEIGKQQYDFYVGKLWQKRDDEIGALKWKKYSEVCFPLVQHKNPNVNQRQILPSEIVLDFENMWGLDAIIEKLKLAQAHFQVFLTGSRGYHIHIYFNRPLLLTEKIAFIKGLGADLQKAYPKGMIALEYAKHWKSGKKKELIYDY